MKNGTKYFRNKHNIAVAGIDAGTLWKLAGKYVTPVDEKSNLHIYYEIHKHWYDEVENLVELQDKQI